MQARNKSNDACLCQSPDRRCLFLSVTAGNPFHLPITFLSHFFQRPRCCTIHNDKSITTTTTITRTITAPATGPMTPLVAQRRSTGGMNNNHANVVSRYAHSRSVGRAPPQQCPWTPAILSPLPGNVAQAALDPDAPMAGISTKAERQANPG